MRELALILGLGSLLILTACGGGSAPSNGGAEDPAPVVEETVGGGTVEETGAPSGDGYVFTAAGTEVVIDAEAVPVIAALGDPDSYYEAASCAFEGLDKYYTYPSYEIDTYPDEVGVERISYVILRDDLVETAEGVCIGDSAEKVESVYGAGDSDGASVTYEKDGMRLMFLFEDGAVTSIQYQTEVLDGAAAD